MAEISPNQAISLPESGPPKRFSYSLAHAGLLSAAVLLLFTLGVIASVSLYYQGHFRQQYLDSMVRVQTELNNEMAASMQTLDHQLFQLAEYDSNISIINTSQDEIAFYRAKMALYQQLSKLAQAFPATDGLFFYSLAADDYTPYIRAVASTECSTAIQSFLTEKLDGVTLTRDLSGSGILLQLSGDSYLARFVASGNSVLGSWTSLTTLLRSLRNVMPEESVVSVLDAENHLLQRGVFPDYVYDDDATDAFQRYTSDGTEYLVNVYALPYADCRLIVFTPASVLSAHLSMVYQGALMLTLTLVLAAFLFSSVFRRLVETPIRALQRALSALRADKKAAIHLDTDSRCQEVRQLFESLNKMLREIQRLEARVYEDKLAQSRLELQFLKSQITPHFLINCLNTFSYLASSSEDDDQAAAQRLTQTLSQHIRYSFATADSVPLSQEFDHLDNYLELAFIRYPGSLSYQLSLAPDCADARISPMTLLTLCENTIKHNLIVGEKLVIRVSAQKETDEAGSFVHIVYLDSGTGYPPEALEHCNHILAHPEFVQDGQHIGIYNIVKANDLIYQDKSRFTFSNEPGAGARVDIRIPCA